MASSTCPACGANAFVRSADGGTCSRCGYSSGESSRCPHCGAVARDDGAGRRAACALCGGPRVPSGWGGEAAASALREQQKAVLTARAASITTVIQAIFAVFSTLIGLAIAPASLLGKVIVFAIAVAPLFLAIRSRSGAARARARAKDAGERAWQAAAEDVAAQSKNGITAPALAKALGIEVDQADELLTALAVHDRTRVDVGEDAEVRYSVRPDALVRVGEDLQGGEELSSEATPAEREGHVR